MYQRNLERAQTNQTLSLLRTIDTLVLESHDSLQSLCSQITKAIADTSEYNWVAIFGKASHNDYLSLLGSSGTGNSPHKQKSSTTLVAYVSARDKWLRSQERTHNLRILHTPEDETISFLHTSGEFVSSLRDQYSVDLIH